MLDARLAQDVHITPITSDTLTANQVEDLLAARSAELFQCKADKAAIVGGYQALRQQLAKGGR